MSKNTAPLGYQSAAGNLFYNLVLAATWVVLNQDASLGSILTGLFFAFLITRFYRRVVTSRLGPAWMVTAFIFVFRFLFELIKANLAVARIVLRPTLKIRPGIIAYPLKSRSDAGITLLADAITLTPGTLSLDVSEDKKTLFVHTLDIEDPKKTEEEIRGSLEQYTARIFP